MQSQLPGFKACLALLFFLLSCAAYAQTIHTVAGDGISGYTGDGASALAAKIWLLGPSGFHINSGSATDLAGNLYFSDVNNNVIRKVDASGIITTIAGTGYNTGTGAGSGAYNGDGIAATAAQLNNPAGIAIDASGNIIFADLNNSRIRKINTAGIISTIVGNGSQACTGNGGQASAATIINPNSIAIDHAGNIYFTDDFCNEVRKVNTAGIISVVAGTGTAGYNGDYIAATSAELNDPTGVAVDGTGLVYIVDKLNNRIRKVDASGIITTVAGNGIAAPFGGDGVVSTSTTVTSPWCMTFDAWGNYYIGENNSRVRMVNTAGIINTVAGTGLNGYSGDGGQATAAKITFASSLTTDNAGNLYINDAGNDRVRKVNMAYMQAGNVAGPQSQITVFPNPATAELTVSMSSTIYTLSVTDFLGRPIFTNHYNSSTAHINITDLIPGVYFIKINGMDIRKFVKQ